MNKKLSLYIVVLAVFALVLAACGGEGETVEVTRIVEVTRVVEAAGEGGGEAEPVTFAGGGDTLAEVQARGILNCGSNASLPGFANVEADGTYTGFDYDFCRAVAAATIGDSQAVEVRATTGTDRFPVLQSGEGDVLIRNTTWTISRDTSLGFDFAPTTFYDGQGMMVREDSGITTLEDFEGGSVCVQAGTTTEKNLADVFRQLGINAESVVFPDNPSTTQAYDEGRCDGLTTDKSGLAAVRTQTNNPDDHIILDATMSKEPLAPVTRHGDNNWNDIVSWTVNCTIQAEELGITSENVDEFLGSEDPVVLNLLGVEGDLGQAMGLENDFCVEILRQVGNYAEIYDRNLGPDTGVFIPRGLNSLYTEGGLLYSPPFR
jgi:general L-amino acid transport system substrate-binding protein